MTITYYPFDAGAGDEVYEAQWSPMARLWAGSGVALGRLNQFEVYADGTAMEVYVKSGHAFIEGHFVESDAEETLTVTAAHPTNPRRDRVILEVDWSSNTITLKMLDGTAAASPVLPTLTQSSSVWQISLAEVYVGAAVSVIAADQVFDEREYIDPHDTELSVEASKPPLTSGVNAAGLTFEESTGAGTVKPVFAYRNFDDGGSATDETILWTEVLVRAPVVDPKLVVGFEMASANVSASIKLTVQICRKRAGQTGAGALEFDTANAEVIDVEDTARIYTEVTIDLTYHDDMRQGDLVCVLLQRTSSDTGNDDASGDVKVSKAALRYI